MSDEQPPPHVTPGYGSRKAGGAIRNTVVEKPLQVAPAARLDNRSSTFGARFVGSNDRSQTNADFWRLSSNVGNRPLAEIQIETLPSAQPAKPRASLRRKL